VKTLKDTLFSLAHQIRDDRVLVREERVPPRHLSDQEEQALVAAVTEKGDVRDQAIIVLMLYTGLRARELCTITRSQVRLGKRSGTLTVQGKRNKYCKIPLNATVLVALVAYDSSLLRPSPGVQPNAEEGA
jgi:integrase/recombinase XerD